MHDYHQNEKDPHICGKYCYGQCAEEGAEQRRGEAADIAAADPLLLAQTVIRNRLPFDQMILYSTFVHISHKPDGLQRGQILYDSTYKEHYPDTL